MSARPRRPRSTTRSTAAKPAAISVISKRPPADPAAFLQHVRALSNRQTEVRALVTAELAKQKTTGGKAAKQPIPPRVTRAIYLKALDTWRTTALARLQDLQVNRTSEGARSLPIPAAHHSEVANLKRRLVVGLSKNSAHAATLQGAQRRWHLAAKAARDGIQVRRDKAREVLGQPLRPDARLHLKLAHATFMVEGNSPRVRKELREAAQQMPKSKGLAYWLARYEVMAGRYPAAFDAVKDAKDYAPVRNTMLPLLDPSSAEAPWLSWPCNFYTYRYSLATDDQLRGMQAALAALTNDPNVVQTWLSLGIPQAALNQLKDRANDGGKAIASLLLWNQANVEFTRSKYASAVRAYENCQRAIVDYFAARYPDLKLPIPAPPDDSGSDISPEQQLESALDRLASGLIRYDAPTRQIWTSFRERYMTVALEELHTHDWRRPNVVPLAYEFAAPLPNYGQSTDFATALARLLIQMGILKSLQTYGEKVEEKLDAPLLAIALVFCPLAIAEANRLRRHFDEGLSQCRQLLNRHSSYKILSEVIEKPFVKILKSQILLDKADAQYKARAMAASPATNPDGSLKYQGLEAAETYQGVLTAFEDQGQYVNRVNAGVASMTTQLQGLLQHTFHPVAVSQPVPGSLPPLTVSDRASFGLVGKKITVETIVSRTGEYPEPDRRIRPHEPLITIEAPGGGDPVPVLLETNPVIYSLLLEARSRLLQMQSGLNYLGYSDSYIPPWRFQFLLDRARYYAEHAKNAQREYLNFLTNAEREEFQELTAAQSVEMEKSNIRIETARVEQSRAEVAAAQESEELAQVTAVNAQLRIDRYVQFDNRMNELESDSFWGSVLGGAAMIGLGVAAAAFAPGALTLGAGLLAAGQAGLPAAMNVLGTRNSNSKEGEKRQLELYNLGLAQVEAEQSAQVAAANRHVAEAGLLVAGTQRAAAVLRHEFALHNLAYLRNRTLNAELWHRLSSSIRGVADTYLRYGIEMAFLAEQAYEFEADKRMDVIRFDYDVSDLGDMLAGDFLLRDLDTLEQDLIVSQRIRQQQVRYVLSLAREFPEALQELRSNGRMTFTLRLEQLERRFPGLFNMRILSVEVLPLALMDATRFSLELTHLGTGQVRLKAQPTDQPDTVAPDWLQGLESVWAIRWRTMGPETAVFSGLTRQDLAGLPSFIVANQRGAFEGLPGSGSWQVDLSMKENRIVPDTLADVLITFTLSGYYDPTLRDAVDHAPRKALATTTWFSAHETFPDAYYEFNRIGKMEWQITTDLIALQGHIEELHNVAVIAVPSQKRPELGRMICGYAVELEVDSNGAVTMLRDLPRFSFTTNGLSLDATFNTPPGSTVTLDFGDGTGLADSTVLPHTYARPGRYDVLVRISANGRLTEYEAAVVVSRQHSVQSPCIAIPQLQATVAAGKVTLQPTLDVPSGESLVVAWRMDDVAPDSGSSPVTFTLDVPAAGTKRRYVLRFSAIRPLKARFYSRQRYVPAVQLNAEGLHLATNRTFDVTTGNETTAGLNAFGQHVFAAGTTLSPIDRWTLEFPLDDNPCLLSVSPGDSKQHDLGELADVFLTLEYKVREN
ncbi:MAG TPA: PKD domain-containing protein [Nitrospira sp.]|nr:PKD domain-containing protein [Nitrospira sp.]